MLGSAPPLIYDTVLLLDLQVVPVGQIRQQDHTGFTGFGKIKTPLHLVVVPT